MSEIRLYPAYTSLERVKAELPPRFSEDSLPDSTIIQYIETRANELDGLLSRYYKMPAQRKDQTGAVQEAVDPDNYHYLAVGYMPSQLETINRYMAASDCIARLLDLRANEEGNKTQFDEKAEALIAQIKTGELILTYPFLHPTDPQQRPYFLGLAKGSPLFGKHPLSANQRIQFVMPEKTFSEDTRW